MKRPPDNGGFTGSSRAHTSVLGSAVADFGSELARFAREAEAEVATLVDALARPAAAAAPTAQAARSTHDDQKRRDAEAEAYLAMLQRTTERVEEEVEAVGSIPGVTAPRAQQLVAAAAAVYAQQAAALQELENLLTDLGVPLPPRCSQHRAHQQQQQQQQQVPEETPENGDVPAAPTSTEAPAQENEPLAAGNTLFSVDLSTGRVSVSHRRTGVFTTLDEDTESATEADETKQQEPSSITQLRARLQEQQQRHQQLQQHQHQHQQPAEVTPLTAAEVPDGGLREPSRTPRPLLAPFESNEELEARVPSFLRNSTLEELNSAIDSLNNAFMDLQQCGKPCQLTQTEALQLLADTRLSIEPHMHPHKEQPRATTQTNRAEVPGKAACPAKGRAHPNDRL